MKMVSYFNLKGYSQITSQVIGNIFLFTIILYFFWEYSAYFRSCIFQFQTLEANRSLVNKSCTRAINESGKLINACKPKLP